jgi:membrane-associated phospholipid phosphatase
MPWERELLFFINRHSSPFLDHVFVLSHLMGTLPFCASVVVAVAGWHLRRHEHRPAALWVILGLSTYFLQVGIKALVDRARPELWDRLVLTGSSSFPSGHAVAGATFYPLLAWSLSHFHPPLKRLWWTLGIALGFYVGFGRLYLGVHWPSDVAAGFAIGAGQTMAGLAALARRERGPGAIVHAE